MTTIYNITEEKSTVDSKNQLDKHVLEKIKLRNNQNFYFLKGGVDYKQANK